MRESRFEPVPFPDIPFAADVRAYCLDMHWKDLRAIGEKERAVVEYSHEAWEVTSGRDIR